MTRARRAAFLGDERLCRRGTLCSGHVSTHRDKQQLSCRLPLYGRAESSMRTSKTNMSNGRFWRTKVAHTTKPSKIDTAVNRKENPLMPSKIDCRLYELCVTGAVLFTGSAFRPQGVWVASAWDRDIQKGRRLRRWAGAWRTPEPPAGGQSRRMGGGHDESALQVRPQPSVAANEKAS